MLENNRNRNCHRFSSHNFWQLQIHANQMNEVLWWFEKKRGARTKDESQINHLTWKQPCSVGNLYLVSTKRNIRQRKTGNGSQSEERKPNFDRYQNFGQTFFCDKEALPQKTRWLTRHPSKRHPVNKLARINFDLSNSPRCEREKVSEIASTDKDK